MAHQLACFGGCTSGKCFNPQVPLVSVWFLLGEALDPLHHCSHRDSEVDTNNVAGFFSQCRPSTRKHIARDVPACKPQDYRVCACVVAHGKQWLLQDRASSPQAWGMLLTTGPTHLSFRCGIRSRANWSALAPRPPPCWAILSQSNPVTGLTACSFHPRITYTAVKSHSVTTMNCHPRLTGQGTEAHGSGALCPGSHSESPSQSQTLKPSFFMLAPRAWISSKPACSNLLTTVWLRLIVSCRPVPQPSETTEGIRGPAAARRGVRAPVKHLAPPKSFEVRKNWRRLEVCSITSLLLSTWKLTSRWIKISCANLISTTFLITELATKEMDE